MAPILNQALTGLLLSLATFSAALPTTTEPCAQVAEAQAKRMKEQPNATSFEVSAELAHACLSSVPFKPADAMKLLDGLPYYWDWQTTLDFLKNPPRGYQVPGTDLDRGIERIRHKARRHEYKNEYEFQVELDALIRTAKDGHFNLNMDLISIFDFTRSTLGPITSVSDNGKSFPKVYSVADLRAQKASAIATIDGQEAASWLARYSFVGFFQDPNALFNGLLYNLPRSPVSANGAFLTTRGIFTGAKTAIRFENGTRKEYPNTAVSSANFAGVKDGQSFYEKFCTGKSFDGLRSAAEPSEKHFVVAESAEISTQDPAAAADLPAPIRESADKQVAGFFLEGEHSNTAVLHLRSFVGFALNNDPLWDFSYTIQKFLEDCRRAKKEKLIIDVSGNRGGTIYLGYDAFKQFLPQGKIETAMNLRAFQQFDVFGSTINYLLHNKSAPQNPDVQKEKDDLFDINAYVDTSGGVDTKGKKFSSWPDYFGPEIASGHKFVKPAFWDFNNERTSLNAGGLIVSGYLNRSNIAPQAFKSENMVLVTDGICASTCAIFADLMNRNGIKSIAAGGNPGFGPMQAVGGVKGSQVLTFRELYDEGKRIYDLYLTSDERKKVENTPFRKMLTTSKYMLTRLINQGNGGRVNYRNAIYIQDKNRIPRHFVNEPADCRIWITKDALLDPKKWWGSIATSWWGNKNKCVFGSTFPN